MANEKPVRFVDDRGQEDSFGYFHGFCAVGKDVFGAGGASKGALRFTSIDIDRFESIDMALLVYVYGSVGGSGQWRFKCWGIDEDNTSDFGSNPFGRSKTSAEQTFNEGQPTSGGAKTINVKDMVQEIVNRSGWNRFNSIGFILEDNGSDSNVWATADGFDTYLVYRIQGEPDFTPTPKTVAAPTFPAVDSYGLKVSFPGVDVRGATADNELLFTTRKDVLKMIDENEVACEGGVETLIPHGLSYTPNAVCFVRKNGLSLPLPRFFVGTSDPVADGVQGWYDVDDTYLRIFTYLDADAYYYIFLDEQAA